MTYQQTLQDQLAEFREKFRKDHENVAQNFARIEIERWDKVLSALISNE